MGLGELLQGGGWEMKDPGDRAEDLELFCFFDCFQTVGRGRLILCLPCFVSCSFSLV